MEESWSWIKPCVMVDDPYGVPSADREKRKGCVLIAGDIRITPLYSVCQLFAEMGDAGPLPLSYGRRSTFLPKLVEVTNDSTALSVLA